MVATLLLTSMWGAVAPLNEPATLIGCAPGRYALSAGEVMAMDGVFGTTVTVTFDVTVTPRTLRPVTVSVLRPEARPASLIVKLPVVSLACVEVTCGARPA